IDQFEASPIRGTDGAFSCFFSPAGDAVGFIGTNRSLKTVSIADGLVHMLTAAEADFNSGSAWGPDNRITFGRGDVLWQIRATGGTPTALTTLDRAGGEVAHSFPAAVGDRAILLTTMLS